MISFEDISIVCQGSIIPDLTKSCLCSLRAVFPGSEIILSTWNGADVSGLDADKTVLSPDPGAFMADEVSNTPSNVNRQLISTKAGIAAARGTYILKTRTDILFLDAEFLSFFGRYDDVPSPFFANRLLICNYFTRNPRVMALCFHPSDWVLFGKAEDVQKYYENTPLMTDEEGYWFKNHKKSTMFFTNYICRFTPEQQVFLGFLRQHLRTDCECYYDRTRTMIKQTERVFAECFVVLDYGKQLRIQFPKYDPNRFMEQYTLITHWQWEALFERYAKGKTSYRWLIYRVRAQMLCAIFSMRLLCIRLLDCLGLKEKAKEWLAKR